MILIDSNLVSVTVCTSFGPDMEYYFPVEVYNDFIKGHYACTFNGACVCIPSFWFVNGDDLTTLPDFDVLTSYIDVLSHDSTLCFKVDADEPLADFVKQLSVRDGWCMEAPY